MPSTQPRQRVMRPDLRLLPIAVAAALAVSGLGAHAQPATNALPVVNGSVTPRNATIGPQAGTAANPVLNITQNAARGVIEWQSFDIGSAARVNIVQPSAQSVLVNRVTPGGSASQIYGRLDANGRVFLVNTAGVTFGAGAQVNVGSLVASTLDLSPSLVANHYDALIDPATGVVTLTQGGNGHLQVSSGATLKADPAGGGSVVLVGQQGVTQAGVIEAVRGQIAIGTASAAQVVLPASSSGFIDLVITAPSAAPGAIAIDGTLNASATSGTGGSVRVDAGPNGSVTLGASGHLAATGQRGGDVTVTGGSVVVAAGNASAIDTSGTNGGGSITVGGDTTRNVYIGQGSVLAADATDTGNGGRIVVKANHLDTAATAPVAREDYGVAEVYGTLLARGGVRGGNGGFVETSGRALSTRSNSATQGLLLASVDARARAAGGVAGTWLIDPFNVTIGNGLQTQFVDQWSPTGTGAQIASGDITAALNAGTSVEVNTGTTAVGTENGTITLLSGTIISRTTAGAATTLTFRAHDSISADGTTFNVNGNAPVNVNFYADLDGNGTGNVVLSNTTVSTGGGDITISGGIDPATGFARGNSQQAGVFLSGSLLETNGDAGRGNVVIRGQGATGSADSGVAVTQSSRVDANNTTVLGLSDRGIGVDLQGASVSTLDGTVDIRGIATRTDATSTQAVGIQASNTTIRANDGAVVLAGRGDDNGVARVVDDNGVAYPAADGLRYDNLTILASANNTNTITLAGHAANSTGTGISFTDVEGGAGLTIVADTSGNIPTLANVSIGAISSDGLALALGLDTNPGGTTVATNGAINFRPVSVSATGQLADATTDAIQVGPIATSNGGFIVTPADGFGSSLRAAGGFIIGSSAHTGAITVVDGALTGLAGQSITLQNEGTGSQGITLGTGTQVRDLTLLSSGEVTQTGAFTVGRSLVLGGGGGFTLTTAGNTVAGTVALAMTSTIEANTSEVASAVLAGPGTVDLLVNGALVVGTANPAAAYDSNTGSFATRTTNTSTTGTSTVLRSADGTVSATHDITTASEGQLALVSPISVTVDAETASLSAPGGLVQAWAPLVNWNPEGRLNLYGCTYPACTLSGITPPSTGLQALIPTRPTVNVVASPANTTDGANLPPLTYTVSGLLAGDDATTALTGALATTATAQSPAGTYAITQGTLASPTGYLVNYTGAALTLAQGGAAAVPLGTAEQVRTGYLAQYRSDVYGRNLDLPFICTAQTVVRDSVAQETQADPLASEWGKVRGQPNLSGCLDVNQGGQCAAF
ncbi:S-layer family protein [Rhizobacter sp. Root1221]|uniref:beta strand repeat-containing protein n=1 Tax=Rhizobacter sp. Root1221 TaxID=1736433 RepID=UPI000713B868|nr:filamentous hemagglutinin N-terminal domain-containing protein [Rhizobacter sp. Root1221]KQV96838.1 hypothetical protein ASC87_24915 [Rhizobacter sp. Root1221]